MTTFMTLPQVCEALSCDEDMVKSFVAHGSLREFRDGGRVNYKAEEINRFALSLGLKSQKNVVTDDVVMQCLNIAQRGHNGQYRRNGDEYITHPLRMVEAAANNDQKAVAALHDVVEDSPDNPYSETFTLQDLRDEGIPEHIVEAVDSVTDREGESYLNFILRSRENHIGREVKLLDLADNLVDSEGNSKAKYEMAVHILRRFWIME